MLNYCVEIRKVLETELKQIDVEESNILKKAEHSIKAINEVLSQLKIRICKNKFTTIDEEIQFFG